MSETQIQALIRIARVAAVAVIGVLIANAADIIGLVGDESTKYLLSLVLVPLLEGIAKLIGGPTEQPLRPEGRLMGVGTAKRPSWLSV